MNTEQIKNIRKKASAIDNFEQCYNDIQLHGDRDGNVKYEQVLAWLIENPDMQDIANEIKNLKV